VHSKKLQIKKMKNIFPAMMGDWVLNDEKEQDNATLQSRKESATYRS